MAFVIVHPEHGIYLGASMGMGFWSKLDPVGQDAAAAFDTEAQAREHMRSWESDATRGVRLVPVSADLEGGMYASIRACVEAGLEGWVDEMTSVANERPC